MIILRVKVYLKTLYPLDSNDYILVTKVKNNKGAVLDIITINSQV